MLRENVGIVRALFEAYLRGAYDEALTCLDPEGVY
jgi:ketosteroid isomerase-like protein